MLEKIYKLIETKHFFEAIELTKKALQNTPTDHRLHYVMSLALLESKQFENALLFGKQCFELSPNNRFYGIHLAKVMLAMGSHHEALLMARQVAETQPNQPETWDAINVVYTHCGELVGAAYAAKQALSLVQNDAHYLFNYAAALRNVGDINGAENYYNKALKIRPDDYEAYKNRSDLQRQTLENNHIDELLLLLGKNQKEETLHGNALMLLNSSLAKEYEDVQQYEHAFEHLECANKLRRSQFDYDVSTEIATMTDLSKAFDKSFFNELSMQNGHCSDEPIFILGMPRTGSTLLERMLSMHDDVFAAGELSHFAMQILRNIRRNNISLSKSHFVEASTAIEFAKLGQDYIQSTRPRTGHTKHFIDKMPNNFLNIGLIKASLPHAKLIHVTRNPMDLCYAVYKTMFKDAYPFSYSQYELAHYYCSYRQLMAHWHKMLPGYILDVKYEDLIIQPEQTLAKVIAFCGLTWQDKCLDFDKNKSPVNTASATQVRQPIYKTSINKWKNVESQLEPLQSILNQKGAFI